MARVGSWDWDRAHDSVTWSDSLRELFAWPSEKPVPSFAQQADLYTPESWARLQRAAAATMESGHPYELELELCIDGPVRWIVARGEPRYDAKGAFVGIHGVVMDVTERHVAEQTRLRLESQLLQSQKMQALGQLAGGVAHDFNNILTSILLQLGTIRDEVGDQPYVASSVEELDRAARRASALTQQLLMFSRRQAPDLRRTDLNGIVHDFSRMLQRLLGEQYTLEFAPSATPTCVLGDRGMLEQVLMNLVINARDAMKPGGRIQVRTRGRAVTAAELPSDAQVALAPGRFIELSVTDSGCGIPLDMQARVFEPFFTTKAAGSGTGLGLATAYGIVAQHGGWMEFTSTPERGTSFRVCLPECDGEEARGVRGGAGVMPAAAAEAARKARVLLVEDEVALRALIERTLRQHGYEVTAAPDVSTAEKVWMGPGSFELLLSDVVLPGARTGIDLVRQLRERDASLRTLLMTGYTEEMDLPGFEERVGSPVLHKPFDVSTLLEAVSSALSLR
jgi:signal transduction histidine kinase